MEKVAILGGGIGGLTAAYELTATPERRARFDVTVYQLGWRLGGKGASGRNASMRQRIEEHGVHVWFGFYDNAFNIMRATYEELARPDGAPLRTLEDAFKPCNDLVLCDEWDGEWSIFQLDIPSNVLPPGGDHAFPTFWEIVVMMLGWADQEWQRLVSTGKVHSPRPTLLERLMVTLGRAAEDDDPEDDPDSVHGLLHRLGRLAERVLDPLADVVERVALTVLADVLAEFRDLIWDHEIRERLGDADLRFFFTTLDLITSIVVGVSDDHLLEVGVHAVDDEEFTAWLVRHGAKAVTEGDRPQHRSPLLRAMYDVSFAFEDGDLTKPNMAAGTCIHVLMRLAFSYHGSLYYKMQAGMGDTVFAPMYQVLKARGVRFEFFTDVTRLGLSEDHASIAEIDITRQARTPGDREYEPLVDVNGLPCWPNAPHYEKLVPGTGPGFAWPAPERFEWPGAVDLGGPETLRQGVEFDRVVLAIPVAAHTTICRELLDDHLRNPTYAEMVESSATVMTQACQLWVNRPISSGAPGPNLGWEHSGDAIVGTFHEPLDTYCPMDQLLVREAWTPQDGVTGIAYFCGVLRDRPGEDEADCDHRVAHRADDVLERHLRWLWPGADVDGAFDWGVLVDLEHRTGPARLDGQYLRANLAPSERYTLTPAGSVGFRLAADESGYDNLSLAGDWVDNGLNSGCIEAAVMSGMQAARDICGEPIRIVGEDFLAGDETQPRALRVRSRSAR